MTDLPRKKPSLFKPIVFFSAIIALLILGNVFHFGSLIVKLKIWILSIGVWGPVVYILIYSAAEILAFPGSVLTVMGGILFGSLPGIVFVSIGSTIGASLAFLVSRHVAKKAIVQRFADNKRYQRLSRLTRDHGAIIVAITRLIPLFPFSLLNYAFGLTEVPFKTYVFWTWLCMLPSTVLYVVGADAVSRVLEQKRIPWGLAGILAFSVALIFFLVRKAKKKLKEKEKVRDDLGT